MSTPLHPSGITSGSGLLLTLLLAASPAIAFAAPISLTAQQTGDVHGTVLRIGTDEPVSGAHVQLGQMDPEAVTDARGRFRIRDAPSGEGFLKVWAPGYVTMVEQVEVRPGARTRVDIRIGPLAGMIDELLVSVPRGLEGDRTRGESMGLISERQIEETGASDAQSVFSGRVPGASVRRSGGQAGEGLQILIRGVNSITQSNEPVFYLDGIRLSRTRSRRLISGVRTDGPLGFLDPASIERVEILKGPAASVRYGPDASAGVILIYTKR